jgi:UDP-glucuronate 4-epimerase
MKILITGVAGFIGMHVAEKLIDQENEVIGIDNLNDYYDINLKKDRLKNLLKRKKNFNFQEIDLVDDHSLNAIFKKEKFEYVINLAAQAGVRYSIENPKSYVNSNIHGFLNLLECCRRYPVKHLVFASSSSVYGLNASIPFSEDDHTDHPLSFYGATKKSNELMAHSYSSLYSIPCTGLRFFTVYGPWGRPDMALFLFTKSILSNLPINIFNNGNMVRDFTYIDDIVESVVRLVHKPSMPSPEFNTFKPSPAISSSPYKIFNIGNSKPVTLMEYISAIELATSKQAIKEFLPMQPGDLHKTFSNTKKLENWVDFVPKTSIKKGVSYFVNWYRNYYNV